MSDAANQPVDILDDHQGGSRSDDTCPSCGRPLDRDHMGGARFVEASGGGGGTDPDPRVLIAIGAAVLVVVVSLIVLLGDRDGDPADDSTPAERAGPELDGPVAQGAEITPERVDAARTVLRSLVGETLIAYLAEEGVVFVDTTPQGELQIVETRYASMGDLLLGFDGVEVFHEGNVSYGIEVGEEEPVVYQLSNQGQVIARDRFEFSVAGDPTVSRNELYVGTAAGVFMRPMEVPVGSEQINVAALGVLVVAPTGETYLARPGWFETFSVHRVVAATPTHHVEVRCDTPLSCQPVLVDRGEATERELPSAFADDVGAVSISPDGRYVVLVNSSSDQIHDTATGSTVEIEEGAKGPLDWDRGSGFAVWLDPASSRPLLRVLDAAGGRVEPIDLGELGAPERSGTAVIVLG